MEIETVLSIPGSDFLIDFFDQDPDFTLEVDFGPRFFTVAGVVGGFAAGSVA